MKVSEFLDKNVYAQGMNVGKIINVIVDMEENYLIGKVKDLYVNEEEWKITHLEVELTKEAKELLGARTAFRNSLAISALGKWPDCCSNDQINLGVTRGQLNIYLRPPK